MAKRAEAATERQRTYATDLGITFDSAISKAELSALIDAHLEKHGKPIPQHFQEWLADGGYRLQRGQGFDTFVASLSAADHDILLCELFAYRIIEELDSKRSWDIGSNPSQRTILKDVARELARKSRAITSIRRVPLKHLVWNPFTGDPRLVGYIEAVNLIQQRFGIGAPIVDTKRTRPKAKTGCLGMAAAIVSLVTLMALTIL